MHEFRPGSTSAWRRPPRAVRTAPLHRAAVMLGTALTLTAGLLFATGGVSQAAASTAADISYANAAVAKYEAAPTFTSPGPAFDISKVKGKSVAVIPATSNEYDNTIEAEMKSLAAKYGVKYTTYPNQGEPSQWVSAMNQAIAAKPNLIILNTALDPSQVLPEVEQAKAAGIAVEATHFYDQTASTALHTSCGGPAKLCSEGLTATVNAPFDLATKTEVDWIIANSKASGHVLLITANDVASSAGMVATAKSEIAAHCPACKLTVANLEVSDWTTKIPTLVETALAKDSDLKYILPVFDFGAPYAVNGITTAGKSDSASVVTYNGTQSVLQLMEKKQPVSVDTGEPLNWLGSAFMDQAFRILAGAKPSPDEYSPIRVFTTSNVALTGTPPTVTGGYGNAYVAGYDKLWKQG